MGGRFLYNCNHNYFYSQQNGKRLSASSLKSYVKNAVFGKTGKPLTPHLLRDIYATYFLDLEYSDAVISALAYSMGHTVEELRKSYDARRSGDKRRPIETALSDVLDQIHGVSSSLSNDNQGTLQQILELLPRLSPTERAKLKQII
ncbi:MAG: site-specific integrase [Cyanobacteria bacterium]|nr:site-specific integrase [Cyanobacteria bacterium CG_2015-16_32_12]NCQ05674.1 site-specific integrase [Cyanobacteria bacterium CG_2015-09_32_10]NCQ42660.1 site-specific integrase [Cyanobacteria bacterium CG_2015-04_32_10]NCS84730.1 site-specific integrase [Cyanobacteria bacterium CG_2015-02_32_10]